MSEQTTLPAGACHGSSRLPSVVVDSYNIELKDQEGFVGDRANQGAFRERLEKWRKVLRKSGEDPLGDKSSEEIAKKELDKALISGAPETAGVVHAAVEEFAKELAAVTKRFLNLKTWRDTERIVVGGGLRASRVGEVAIGRASVILKADKFNIELTPIRNHPDEAGLIGAVHLAPRWMFEAHDAILAADIGGSNIRAGLVELALKKAPDLSRASVLKSERWRHADEKKVSRADAVKTLVDMLQRLIALAQKEKLRLAPFIGIGCPGLITADGRIDRGGENLPGNWEGKNFNLPRVLVENIPKIQQDDTLVVMHNDAVVQGLSERPAMDDVKRWGVLTIGTGLGNARFTNRRDDET